jgi:hypothetical protein
MARIFQPPIPHQRRLPALPGYLFGRPLPVGEFEALPALRGWGRRFAPNGAMDRGAA